MPNANTLPIGIFATLAQHKQELISGRTKAAMAAKVAQGHRPGKPENLTSAGRLKDTQSTKERAASNENSRRATALINKWTAKGMTYMAIAAQRNE
ncbi:hypothetical protein GCM10027347_46800 [Larkinella harenae]